MMCANQFCTRVVVDNSFNQLEFYFSLESHYGHDRWVTWAEFQILQDSVKYEHEEL
jgi:hypothetical protein